MLLNSLPGKENLPNKKNTCACDSSVPIRVFNQDNRNRGFNEGISEIKNIELDIDLEEMADALYDPWDRGLLSTKKSCLIIAK